MSENEKQRLFTLEEANALVPELNRLIGHVQKKYRELLQELAKRGLTPDALEEALTTSEHADLQAYLDEITAAIAEIEGYGCHFKGLDLGLVDFPAMINDEVAYLCWQYGEERVAFWHTLEGGFKARQAIAPEAPGRHSIN